MSQDPFSQESLRQRERIIGEHGVLVKQLRDIEAVISRMAEEKDPQWRELEKKRSVLQRGLEPLITEYWQWISPVVLSRCPFCDEELRRIFDPVDLRGFWWMERTQRPGKEPANCPHFCLLLGALNFNGIPPRSGPFPCRPGPDMPYIVPRILKRPGMAAVISRKEMNCGYIAYPIAYFCEAPVAGGTMTQGWARREYGFVTEDGRRGWDQKEETWEFRMTSWIEQGKVRWRDDNGFIVDSSSPDDYPFKDIRGKGKPQHIIADNLTYTIL